MERYNIIDDKNQYWSHNKEFGYWSKFKDNGAIENRVQYNVLTGYLQILFMKILGTDMKVKLAHVLGE